MSAIEIRNIDHVVIRAADLERAIRFYCEILGCEVERRVDNIGLIQMRAGAAMIDLFDAKENPPPDGPGNMDHFALRLDKFDEDAIHAFLSEHDIESEPSKSRYGAEGDGPSIYIKDPDGNTVELKGPPY